jgi:hypothetical protein
VTTHRHRAGKWRYPGGTPTYRAWVSMRTKCRDARNPYYGGKGVTVDPRWDDSAVFLSDLGERPIGCRLERREKSLGFTPENVEWTLRPRSAARASAAGVAAARRDLRLTIALSHHVAGAEPQPVTCVGVRSS